VTAGPAAPWSRSELTILAAIVGLGAALRVGVAILIPSVLESDYLEYWTLANNLHDGRGLIGREGYPTAFLNLGYPLFLAGIFAALGASIAAVKAANVVLGVASLVLLYVATRRLFGHRSVAALATALFAIYPEAVIYTTYAAKENLMVFLATAQLALAARHGAGAGRSRDAVLFGLSVGAMALVGNAGLVLLPALLLLVFSIGGAVRMLRYVAVAALAASLVVAPVLWRNHAVFGAYVLNNNGGFNLYIGNNPRAEPYFQSIAETPIGTGWPALIARLGEHGADAALRDLALQYMAENPGATLRLALRKAMAFWWPSLHAGEYTEGALETVGRIAWLIEFCAIGALFLLAGLRWREYGRSLTVLWLLVAAYTAIHMIFYVSYRYRLPIMPVLCIGAGLGAQIVLQSLSRRPRDAAISS
jgi:4-amino-4-deoxy-L-arabinose transferase-like glycosyltransferase